MDMAWEKTPCDITKIKDFAIQEYLETPSKYCFWCNLKFAQKKGLQFYQRRSYAVVLNNTLLAACMEKAVCMKTKGRALPEDVVNSQSTTCRSNMVNEIHKAKTQDHLENHWAIRKVTGKYVTTPCITKYLVYLFLPSSCRIHHARTRSRGWSTSSSTTNIKNHSFRTWARRRRSTSSANNRRTLSPTWTTPRSSNYAKILANSNVLMSAIPTGKPVYCSSGRNLKIFSETKRVRPEQPWRHLNPWICDLEQQSWSQARTFWTTKNVLSGETDA